MYNLFMYAQLQTQLRIHYFKKYWFHLVIRLVIATLLRVHLIKYLLVTLEHPKAVHQLVPVNQQLAQLI